MTQAQELWFRYRRNRDPADREALISQYLPLVKYVAGRLALGLPAHVEVGDLEGFGLFGLLDAIDKFDPARGVQFKTYASARIRGAILDGLRAQDPAPPAWRDRQRRMEQAYGAVEARLGRSAEEHEVASELGVSVAELRRWEAEAAAMASVALDDLWHQGDDGGDRPLTGADMIGDPSPGPEDRALIDDRNRILGEAIERLPEKERLVITLYYYEELTAKEIARILGVTPARISQLHGRALLRLRGELATERAARLFPGS